ncbi:unnamed protein product [Bursaphelenchus okinawaensis]|uniref:F-box domain-containing protein n=1 Tax=Bursaphelenchus okinawaensis TaxID=465554 RepID=A0A811JTS8_9BILA|nr:unnamed protein product [Bursaphelenchus okinawaensis]CAG9082587.1 unnamed protein product [Bursaphelenchus okinawaensis]
MSRLFNRLSFRRKPRQRAPDGTKSAPLSCPDLTCCTRSDGSSMETAFLPAAMLSKSLKMVDNVFELTRLRSVSSVFCNLVDERLCQVVFMDVKRVDFEYFSIKSLACDVGTWYQHPHGLRLYARLTETEVHILVDEQWTSKEVGALCGLMKVFRKSLVKIALDAAIVELVIANLSLLDLDRWYAFQCYIQAIQDPRVHLNFQTLPALADKDGLKEHYWPSVEKLVIRTTERDSVHLARLLDYGVRSHSVVNRIKLVELKVEVEGVDKMNRGLNRNLYHFRCWAGSAGFDDRFSQKFAIGIV